MKKKKSVFSQWWFWFMLILTIAAVTIAITFKINEAYKENSGYITLWEAKDVLSFYGSYLAFIGTVSLGGLALWQNFRLYATTSKQEGVLIIRVPMDTLNSEKKITYPLRYQNPFGSIFTQKIEVKKLHNMVLVETQMIIEIKD